MEKARRHAVTTTLLVLLVLASTTARTQTPPGDIEGSTWVLREIDAGQVPLPGLPVLTTFAGGSVSGSAGCNDYQAGYGVREATGLGVDGIFATRRTCEPLVMAQEDEFIAKLQGANRFELLDGDLVLDYWLGWMDGHFGTLRFERLVVPEDLSGAPWAWVRYEDPVVGGVEIANPGDFVLAFGGQGRLSLVTDCLEADLPYAVDGANLAINTRGLDLSDCTGDSPSRRLVRDLEAVGIFSLNGGRLLLGLFADSGALLFERAP